jgi:hypothetical protein
MSTPSTYPSPKLDRHGTPRDCPAADWTCKRLASYTGLQRALAASLVPYVTEDDCELTREQFLWVVASRISDDLIYKTF